MREPTKESPIDRGEVLVPGVCQVCGAEGPTIELPGADAPNAFCPACAIEYGEGAAEYDEA